MSGSKTGRVQRTSQPVKASRASTGVFRGGPPTLSNTQSARTVRPSTMTSTASPVSCSRATRPVTNRNPGQPAVSSRTTRSRSGRCTTRYRYRPSGSTASVPPACTRTWP